MLQNVDDAMRRRFNIVPFSHRLQTPDRALEDKLRGEWPGILRWMIEGCTDWQRAGLIRSQKVTETTDTYFTDQDLFGEWLAVKCDAVPIDQRLQDASGALFKSWSEFATAAGEKPGNMRTFAERLRRRRFQPYRDMHSRGYRGIRLLTEERKRLFPDEPHAFQSQFHDAG
jgi:putative DNA primase/helicase